MRHEMNIDERPLTGLRHGVSIWRKNGEWVGICSCGKATSSPSSVEVGDYFRRAGCLNAA